VQFRGLRAHGMTLFEILVAVALLGAVMAITLPLIVSQTQRLTYGEVVAQIERHAAVVRSDSQRQSEAIWFEARWIEKENAWALGIAQQKRDEGSESSDADDLAEALLGEMEMAFADDSTDRLPMFADGPEMMAGFEVRMRLPKGYRIERTLPQEVQALGEQGGVSGAGNGGLVPDAFEELALEAQGGAGFDDEVLPVERERVLLAVFLPDGTLIGPERVYLFAPGGRIATISMSPWLGRVRCETLTLEMLTASSPDDEALDEALEPQEDDVLEAPGPVSDEPAETGGGA
jgi:prepilin-type N-terminal cleavage/methylation domain-containing protein